MVVGGWWWLAVGGGWRLAVGGGWRLVAVLQGGPHKKKIEYPKDPPVRTAVAAATGGSQKRTVQTPLRQGQGHVPGRPLPPSGLQLCAGGLPCSGG